MNILFAASEMAPFCKTGGLADVIGALPPSLASLGHSVSVMIPGYSVIDRRKYGFTRISTRLVSVPVGLREKPLALSHAFHDGVAVYLIENDEYFNRPGLYGDAHGDYSDNGVRFAFFARSVVELMKALELKPDIVHAHDWQTGLVMAYLATVYRDDGWFRNTGTLFTIHNLGYQGLFHHDVFLLTDIPREEYNWRKMEFWGNVSFIKSGIVYANAVSTVSERYADEITREPLGFGLHGVLAERRHDLSGIVNGIDQQIWDPATDSDIASTYTAQNHDGKKACRAWLRNACGFDSHAGMPVFGMVTRLDNQKGLDILEDAMERLALLKIRIVLLGMGSMEHQNAMRTLAIRFPDKLHVTIGFDNVYARRIYAGADAFIMPSRYEPCGLGQLIAMRYGTLPVVHETGGLADTVQDMDRDPANGTGFVFRQYSPEALIDAVSRALALFSAPGRRRWNAAMTRAMSGDYSWTKSAQRYFTLYEHIGNKKHR